MRKIIVPVIAIITIGGIEFYALSQGINGVVMTCSIAAISGIAGYQLKGFKFKSLIPHLKSLKKVDHAG